MQPSSLIFVVIVAIWAAYLLQHWIRRREALVTARSVDQFSEAMRVLEHRGSSTTVDARDDKVVKKKGAMSAPAQASTPLPRTSLRAGSVMTDDTPRSSHSVPRWPEPACQREVPPGSVRYFAGTPTEQTRTLLEEPLEEVGTESAPVRVGSRVIRGLAALNSRRVRGIALLASLALLLFAIVLAPLGKLPWWSPVVSLVLAGGVFAWLRKEAVAEQSARQAARDDLPAKRPVQQPETHSGPQLGGTQRTPLPARDTVFDHAQPAAPSASAKPTPQAEQVEGGWSPVPVPRPTYTMKAKAEPAPVAPERTQSTAERHADTPIDELPFDGLALDEDLEELPSVFRAV